MKKIIKTPQYQCQSIWNGETNQVENCTCGKCADSIKRPLPNQEPVERDELRSNCCNAEVISDDEWRCSKCDKACDLKHNECKECHRTSDVVDMSRCPFCNSEDNNIKQEILDTWEEECADGWEVTKPKRAAENTLILFKSLLADQIALSRAEVLEEIRGKVERMRVITMISPSKFGDGKPTQIPTSEWGEGFNKALSDTLAVVEELKQKEYSDKDWEMLNDAKKQSQEFENRRGSEKK